MPQTDLLARAADRAALRPGFIAHAYTAEQVRAALGCDAATAHRLRLCRLPSADWPRPGRWEADVAALAAWAGVDAGALGKLLGPLAGKAG